MSSPDQILLLTAADTPGKSHEIRGASAAARMGMAAAGSFNDSETPMRRCVRNRYVMHRISVACSSEAWVVGSGVTASYGVKKCGDDE